MKSHAVKIILAGCVLEALFMTRGHNRRPLTTVEITERINEDLREGKFNGYAASYIRQAGGVTPKQVSWLLRVMQKTQSMPFGFKNVPLVKFCGERTGEWVIVNTSGRRKREGRNPR